MPTKGNNCLLYSLTYDGAPRGSDQSAASMRALREAIATTAVAHRDNDLNGMTLEDWVSATADMDLESWAADFVANDTMSDQIVLRIWPLFRGEPVWVWQPSRAGGYENHAAFRFGAPSTGRAARHVLYRPAQLHYNALQVIRPAALKRPAVKTTMPRPQWSLQRSQPAAKQQKLLLPPTSAIKARACPSLSPSASYLVPTLAAYTS